MRNNPTDVIADYTVTAPVNLEGLISALGIRLIIDPGLPSNIAGKLQRDSTTEAGFRIVVNGNDNPRRRRFTMAHEIAHFVLHRDLFDGDIVDDAMYRSNLSDEYERQANRYAAQILLPAPAVRGAYAHTKALGPLARLFDVSDSALRIRLSELGLAA